MIRILASENVPAALVRLLRERRYDVEWIAETNPGATDSRVITIARRSRRVILTLDKDYGHLLAGPDRPLAGAILVRLSASKPGEQARIVADAIDGRADWAGHFSVIEPGRVRMTPLGHAR